MLFKTSFFAVALAIISAAVTVDAHVGMKSPCPRYGAFKNCPAPPRGQRIDYDVNSPIGTHDRILEPICKHKVPYTKRAVYRAGQTINTEYDVGASHGGGHCQWALSYDGGKTWVVLRTIIRDCLKGIKHKGNYRVPVKIPANAPSGKRVTFMWMWNNAIGNRELYSNCADIEIRGTNGGRLTGVAPLVANYGRSSPRIGEFPNARDKDGHELFSKRRRVTINVPRGA